MTTNTAIKNSIISARILAHMQAGKSVAEAMDAVLGAGTFERVSGELYDALRAKAAAATK